MQNETPKLGQLVEWQAFRDAVHVAVAPVVAGERLSPGFHVRLKDGRAYSDSEDLVGVVDPFLLADVEPGQTFWLFVYPNTVTSLRHAWTHRAFVVTPPPPPLAAASPPPTPSQDEVALLRERIKELETRLSESEEENEEPRCGC